jgi:mono/diheme cytochrome c family protein
MLRRWTAIYRLRLARWIVVAGAGVSICGCAGETQAAREASVARGAALAERVCGACHGLGLTGASSSERAPPFRDMRFDYNEISYERRMAQLHHGHVRMPPEDVSLEDVADIGAYIRSLKSHGPHN